jgi:hypothetical protein
MTGPASRMNQFLPSDFDELRWLISRGNADEALEVGRRLRREYVLVHDGLRGQDPASVQARLRDNPEVSSWIASFRDLVVDRGLEDGEEEATATSVWRLPSGDYRHDRF